MREYTEEDIKRFEHIIDTHDREAALAELSELHPADIAELYQKLDLSQAEWLFGLLDEETAADVLMELD